MIQTKQKQLFYLSLLILFIGLIWLFYPSKPKGNSIPAAYFWESDQYNLTDDENAFVHEHQLKKLYVKFFEVDFNPHTGAFPISKTALTLQDPLYDSLEIIPTVFIRNVVFKYATPESQEELVENVMYLIRKRFEEQFGIQQLKEIQIDCDWTISTKENYHAFLKLLKQKMGKLSLSATLRLYPYKFPDKMGVLPVDKAMLMCYNLISPFDAPNRNSILDLPELEKYLVGAEKYPVPLDIALPTFSAVHVYKNKHFYRMINTNAKDIQSCSKALKGSWFVMTKDTTIASVFLRKGDQLKIETISSKRLKKAMLLIQQQVEFDQAPVVALFYLDENQLKTYSYETIHSAYTFYKP